MAYVKLFGSILASTIWREPPATCKLWITMLAMADRDGLVEGSVPGLADMARISVDECRVALKSLESPDPDSRTQTNEGRRVQKVQGGWLVLNYEFYRDKQSIEDTREKNRLRQKRKYDRDKVSRENHAHHATSPDITTSSPSDPILNSEGSHPAGHPAGREREEIPSGSGPEDRAGPEGRREQDLFDALRLSPYRENSQNRTHELMLAARRLCEVGISVTDLRKLARLANSRGKKPDGLLAHWIDHTDEALKELSKR